MITLTNLSKIFRTELIETHALREVNLQVNEGEFAALTGPSGSGKSTLLNILGTLENFDSGDYLLDGQSVKGLSDAALSKLRNEKIGFIFQSFNLIKDFSIYDNIELPLRYRGLNASARKQRIEQALELVGLHARRDYLPGQLSGGQQQRVAIARALVHEPPLLICDEPTSALDKDTGGHIMQLVRDLSRSPERCVVVVTHDHRIFRFADRIAEMEDGRISRVVDDPKLLDTTHL